MYVLYIWALSEVLKHFRKKDSSMESLNLKIMVVKA